MWNEQKVHVPIESSRLCCPSRPSQLVFIVSGDHFVRSELQSVLAAYGLHAVVFETAAGYLASAKPDVPSCLILDVTLPDMSGLDLQQQVVASGPPVIFVTGHGEVADSVRAMKAGALDFFTLPFEPKLLLVSVRSAINLDASACANRKKLTGMRERFETVTPRERQVLQLIVSGLMNKQVAGKLGISEITVQVHRRQVMRKMGATSFADLVRIAGILQIPSDDDPQPERSRGYTRSGVAGGASASLAL